MEGRSSTFKRGERSGWAPGWPLIQEYTHSTNGNILNFIKYYLNIYNIVNIILKYLFKYKILSYFKRKETDKVGGIREVGGRKMS